MDNNVYNQDYRWAVDQGIIQKSYEFKKNITIIFNHELNKWSIVYDDIECLVDSVVIKTEIVTDHLGIIKCYGRAYVEGNSAIIKRK